MKEEEVLSKRVYRSLLYVLPVLNNEGVNLAHFWICRKLTKIGQNWMWIIQIWKERLHIVIYGMKEEEMLSKKVYRSLLYVLPVLNYEGVNLAHFWIWRKLTKISQNWMWIIQIWKERLHSVIYGMKEEEMLSKMVYRSLLYVLPVLNYEGVNLAHFWICRKLTKISQNWMWIIQIWKERLQSVIYGR